MKDLAGPGLDLQHIATVTKLFLHNCWSDGRWFANLCWIWPSKYELHSSHLPHMKQVL